MGIFSRKRSTDLSEVADEVEVDDIDSADPDDAEELDDPDDWDEDAETADDEADDWDEDEEDELELDEWAQLDLSRDWREDGPFDVSEVDLDADEVTRADLGALIVTPEPGLRIQLPVDHATKTAPGVIISAGDASIQVRVLAAPGSTGYAAEYRQRLIDETLAASGQAECTAGPFGTEIRRVIVTSTEGAPAAKQVTRDWLVEGPRWLLHAQLLGKAATDTAGQGPAAELEEIFRNLVVRRGDGAIVPGSPVPLHAPGQR